MENKVVTIKKALALRLTMKKKKQIVSALSGSFDLLHPGHVFLLQEAKKQGDVLFVFLNSDSSVQKYKGTLRPVMKQKDRALLLSALPCVDYVIIMNDINPRKILSKLQPDVYCNGYDWGHDCIGKWTVKKNGGRIHIIKRAGKYSSSSLLEKAACIIKFEKKAVFFTSSILLKKELKNKKQINGMKVFSPSRQAGRGRDEFFKFIQETANEQDVNLSKSFLVADSIDSIAWAREMNMKTIMFGERKKTCVQADYYVKSLKQVFSKEGNSA